MFTCCFDQLLTLALGSHPDDSFVVGAIANCVSTVAEVKSTVIFLCSAGVPSSLLSTLEAGVVDDDGANASHLLACLIDRFSNQ